MNFTHPAHQEMILALLQNDVEFILIGGYAVIYHGYVRTTGDMDVWLNPSDDNKQKLLKVFTLLDFDPEGIKIIEDMDFQDVVVFHIGIEPERIDFLSKVEGLNFEEAFRQKEILHMESYAIPFLRLDDLIANKLLVNRNKDKADIENLIKINKLRFK